MRADQGGRLGDALARAGLRLEVERRAAPREFRGAVVALETPAAAASSPTVGVPPLASRPRALPRILSLVATILEQD